MIMFKIWITFIALFACVLAHRHSCRHSQSPDTGASAPAPAESASSGAGAGAGAGPLTRSAAGVFSGSWMETRRGRRFQAYRGIRYAEPPVGPLRFQPPRDILCYEGVVDASEEGPSCPQRSRRLGYYIDEDCLSLNVYTPDNNSSRRLPVILYIHAGGLYSMSGRSDLAGPHYLLDRDIVLVTINYRYATLGFISTGDALAPGNNGFKDQVSALRWTQRNIASFGGDPQLVTLAGCSAGSTSVVLHMVSPMSKGLFHRAISVSGAPLATARSPSDQFQLAARQARLVGCPDSTSEEIMACLRTKHWKELADSLSGFFEFGYDPIRLWVAVVEPDFGQERFLPIDPVDAIQQGKINAVPHIVSQSEGEFFWKAHYVLPNKTLLDTMNNEWERVAPISFMLPRENSSAAVARLRHEYLHDKQLANDQISAEELGKLYGDAVTGFPVHRLANLMCRHSPQPIWYYEFSYVGEHSHYEDPDTKKPIAAAHQDDLIYLFTLSYRFPSVPLNSSDSVIVDRMTAMWYNFAKHGDPNPRGDLPELSSLSWPVMTPERRTYLRIDKEFSLGTNLKEDRMKIWEELYPIQY